MTTTGKCFVLKHVFKNVSNMKEDEYHYSEAEEYYGVEWRMKACRTKEHLQFYFNCVKTAEVGKWTIEAQRKQVLLSKSTENRFKEGSATFGTTNTFHGT
ncbi:hypothetical protein CRE_11378 [Caenorhabditis remanei]|uniref:MATH domain-containing protein n=1 Tax=Caenorhabditis remanei TaxID=31234 RepID=E3N737_CAERE|nr:hypothetical protein CRE_11378 [Caenorhabditis remanei]